MAGSIVRCFHSCACVSSMSRICHREPSVLAASGMLVHTENAATLPDTHVTGWTTGRLLTTTPRSAWPELSAISTPYEIGRLSSDGFFSAGFGDASCAKTDAHDATANHTAVAVLMELGVQKSMRVMGSTQPVRGDARLRWDAVSRRILGSVPTWDRSENPEFGAYFGNGEILSSVPTSGTSGKDLRVSGHHCNLTS